MQKTIIAESVAAAPANEKTRNVAKLAQFRL
jgi:hypothetical protein